MNELKPHEMFMKNNNLKKSGVKVQYSEDDIKEIIKCKNDVIYFIEKYVKIISTDDGKVPFEMYPFQKAMIRAYKDQQQVICLTCRQAGKCVVGDTEIEVLSPEGRKKKIAIGELYAILRNQEGQFGSGSDTKGTGFMSVPAKKLSGSEVDCRWSGKETHLAGTLEISPIEKKFVHSQKVRGWKINGSCGWAPLTYIHKTVPYEVWNIEFENGNHVRCADNHIFIGLFNNEIFAKHLYPGIMIKSKEGMTKVRTVNLFHVKEEMYDPEIEIGFQPHYFSNGILSHNTTTSAAFLLWQMLFTTDLTVAILANKAATAHEILARLKLMYECLPIFLQPGVVVWNRTSIELANNCKAISAATSSSSIRGMSISCVTGDTLVCVEKDEDEIFYTTIDEINESKLVNDKNHKMKADTPEKYYTVYRILNLVNGKEYIGFHDTIDLNDGYMGSGKLIRKAIEKYGPENFEKEYIAIFDREEDAEELERNIIDYVLREETGEVKRFPKDHEIILPRIRGTGKRKRKWKILTQKGFKKFDGFISRQKTSSLIEIHTDETSIKCTADHQLMMSDGKFEKAEDINISDVLYNGKKVRSIELIQLDESIEVYDALNVDDTHSYLTNGFVSHNCLYLDEFAHIKNDVEFFTSTYPVISSGKKSRVIVTSTPNGMNLFYKLWMDAQEEKNDFFPIKFTWRDHPNRDEAWAEKTKKIMGLESFAQEHEGEFMGSSGTLISGQKLKTLTFIDPSREIPHYKEYQAPARGRSYVACIDVSEGVGNDYSVCTIVDVTEQPFSVSAIYRDNTIVPDALADTVYPILRAYNDPYCIIETNGVGVIVGDNLIHELEYENIMMSESKVGKIQPSSKAKSTVGIRQTKSTKKIGCSRLKQLIESDSLILNDYDLIQELYSFSRKGSSYEAEKGKTDDIVMSLVLFGWLVEQEIFTELTSDNIKKLLRQQYVDTQYGDDMDFGFCVDGTEDPYFDEEFHRVVNNQSDFREPHNHW